VVEKMVRGGRNGREIEKEWLGQENDGIKQIWRSEFGVWSCWNNGDNNIRYLLSFKIKYIGKVIMSLQANLKFALSDSEWGESG
jgi:hypothetical protein